MFAKAQSGLKHLGEWRIAPKRVKTFRVKHAECLSDVGEIKHENILLIVAQLHLASALISTRQN